MFESQRERLKYGPIRNILGRGAESQAYWSLNPFTPTEADKIDTGFGRIQRSLRASVEVRDAPTFTSEVQ